MLKKEQMYKIVEAIKEVGPRNISEIARITRLPIETVRYKIKKQLKEKGITIRASINYGKIGLRRYWLNLYFTDRGERRAAEMLNLLAMRGYLTYYARTLPKRIYVAMVTLPPRFKGEYIKMLDELVNMDVLANYDMWEMAWLRHISMRQEYFDFDKGEWAIDWSKIEKEPIRIEEMPIEKIETRVDKIDLLILAYLQANSFLSLSKIARMLNKNPKKLRYHYTEHVLKRGLINKYVVYWTSIGQGRALWMFFQFTDLDKKRLLQLENTFHKIPFIFLDGVSVSCSFYLVGLIASLKHYLNTLQFASAALSETPYNSELMIVDLSFVRTFSLPFEMFDDEKREWVFDKQLVLEPARQILLRL